MVMLGLMLLLQATGVPPVEAPAATAKAACKVVKAKPEGPADLFLACGKRAAGLGSADSFATRYNAASGSTLVVLTTGSSARVLLASPSAGGLHLDDITRDLAIAAGRSPDAPLNAGDVDVARFEADGSVSLPARSSAPAPTGKAMIAGAKQRAASAAATAPATLDLKPYASRAAAMPTAKRLSATTSSAAGATPAAATNDH